MTDKQLKHFYFPAWNACCRNNGWRMEKTRLVGQRAEKFGAYPDVNELHQRVWTIAKQQALAEHREVKPDDFRHAVHIVALKTDKSSKDLTNPEVDRVVNLFKLLTDPDNLDAVLNFQHPENAERERLIWSIEHAVKGDAYTRAVSNGKFHTKEWRDLHTWQLRQLAMTLRGRDQNYHKKLAPVDDGVPASNKPF